MPIQDDLASESLRRIEEEVQRDRAILKQHVDVFFKLAGEFRQLRKASEEGCESRGTFAELAPPRIRELIGALAEMQQAVSRVAVAEARRDGYNKAPRKHPGEMSP